MINPNNLYILIAEDDEDDAIVIENCFIESKHFNKISMVKNGQELLDFLENNDKPDVILTDINMPIVDGIEALKIILSSNRSEIPCFVYSTSINPIYEEQCKKLGVKGYLVKPYSLEEFDAIPEAIIATLTR